VHRLGFSGVKSKAVSEIAPYNLKQGTIWGDSHL